MAIYFKRVLAKVRDVNDGGNLLRRPRVADPAQQLGEDLLDTRPRTVAAAVLEPEEQRVVAGGAREESTATRMVLTSGRVVGFSSRS